MISLPYPVFLREHPREIMRHNLAPGFAHGVIRKDMRVIGQGNGQWPRGRRLTRMRSSSISSRPIRYSCRETLQTTGTVFLQPMANLHLWQLHCIGYFVDGLGGAALTLLAIALPPLMYGGHPYHHVGMPGTVILREHEAA